VQDKRNIFDFVGLLTNIIPILFARLYFPHFEVCLSSTGEVSAYLAYMFEGTATSIQSLDKLLYQPQLDIMRR
jgi:hypothetical protein